MQARVRTGYADLESCARNQVEVGWEAASERELEELAPIIRSDPPITRGQQRSAEASHSLQDSMLCSSQSDNSEPPNAFSTDSGDRSESAPRRNAGWYQTPHHPTYMGLTGPITHEAMARLPRTNVTNPPVQTHSTHSSESVARIASRKHQATLKENDWNSEFANWH